MLHGPKRFVNFGTDVYDRWARAIKKENFR
jgi:hypothetical protein